MVGMLRVLMEERIGVYLGVSMKVLLVHIPASTPTPLVTLFWGPFWTPSVSLLSTPNRDMPA